ncbi:MAG: hypothetical protein ISS41_11420 [Candidatus Aminicenantes bacterium]|nr:hypothetical protein [Candidatus Aminicenantes bacterium]
MGILFTILMGFLLTITMGILFTIVLGIQLTISNACHVKANKDEKVPPIDAGMLSVFVKHYVLINRKKLPNYEKDFADNKELKGKIVGT